MAPYVSRIAKTDRYFDHVNPSIGGSDTRVNIPPSGRPDELRYKRADVGARRIAFLDNIVAHHLWPTGTSDGGRHEIRRHDVIKTNVTFLGGGCRCASEDSTCLRHAFLKSRCTGCQAEASTR